MMSYLVVENTSKVVVENEVMDNEKLGYVCQGGIAISILPPSKNYPPIYTVHYAQAMVLSQEKLKNAESNS